jgi:hypothetical protein
LGKPQLFSNLEEKDASRRCPGFLKNHSISEKAEELYTICVQLLHHVFSKFSSAMPFSTDAFPNRADK